MFKVLSQKEMIRIVERAGFVLIRNSEHKVFQKGNVIIFIPHSKTISSGLVHQLHKQIKAA